MNQNQLERYSFLWSQARMVIAAIALFLGGFPPIYKIVALMPFLYGLASASLKLAWIVSGISSGYLLYLWIQNGKKLFGAEDKKDLIAFLVMIVSGINLGFVGFFGTNIGMSLISNYAIFVLTGLVYLISAYYLYQRWSTNGQKLF